MKSSGFSDNAEWKQSATKNIYKLHPPHAAEIAQGLIDTGNAGKSIGVFADDLCKAGDLVLVDHADEHRLFLMAVPAFCFDDGRTML